MYSHRFFFYYTAMRAIILSERWSEEKIFYLDYTFLQSCDIIKGKKRKGDFICHIYQIFKPY